MLSTRRRDTAAEKAVRAELWRMGLRYRVDTPVLPGSRRRADLVFARVRVAVFVDGCFWHGCPAHATWPVANEAWWRAKLERNVARDQDTDAELARAGWTVVRIWEHEDARQAAERVQRLVGERRDA